MCTVSGGIPIQLFSLLSYPFGTWTCMFFWFKALTCHNYDIMYQKQKILRSCIEVPTTNCRASLIDLENLNEHRQQPPDALWPKFLEAQFACL